MENVNKDFIDSKKDIIRNIFKKEESKKKPLLPDPIMHLKFILGFTSVHCPTAIFHSSGEYETQSHTILVNKAQSASKRKNIFFASGNTVIKYDHAELKQSFYFGHSKPITHFLIACNGEVMFSAQEGANAIIRVWRVENTRCIKMLTTPYDKISSMTVSKDSKTLATVGNDSYNKELIILWDINDLDDIKVFVRQTSPSPVNSMKFSPFESNIIFSCGRENIKSWRIKNDHIGGKAVVLNQYARTTDFLCIDFNNPIIGDEFNKGKAFIGASTGCVFQVNCENQELEAVYKVQNSSLLSICVNDAFCATGSLDGFLRIWPIDFSEFLIEAKHDSGVCSVDISFDALDIICGTTNGSIGILNVQTKEYKTILRSPPNKVLLMVAHPDGNFLFTIEDDKSIRVWDVERKSEAFQFISAKDPPTAIGVPKKMTFAAGFTSGILKIFDLEKTEIIYECKSFQSQIQHLIFIQGDSLLISMSSQGNMSIHDALSNFMQIKLIKIDEPTMNTDISLSIDQEYFATIGPESNCALVWNAKTFGIKNRIPINNFFIKKVCLMNKNVIGIVLENCCVQFYSLAAYEGFLIKEFVGIHINKINEFLVTKNYKFFISGGEEGMIKIWDSKMLYKPYQSFQQFIGHSAGIRSIIILEQKSLLISASESSGIYFWNFLGDVTFCETEITQEFEKFGDVKEMREFMCNKLNSSNNRIDISSMKRSQSSQINTMSNIKKAHLERTYNVEHNPNYQILKKTFDSGSEQIQTLNMLPVIEDKEGVDLSYSNSEFNFSSEYVDKYPISGVKIDEIMGQIFFKPKYLPQKVDQYIAPVLNSNKLTKLFCLGYSVCSRNNIVYNKENKWYAYTVNNKIIVEYLDEMRTQVILEDNADEISCIALAPDMKSLVSGTGSVFKEEYAPICVWDTSNWTLKKKLNFHFKGIQAIKFNQNGKYMITIGNSEEKSICVWNFTNLTIIDSKSLKFSPIDIACEKNSISTLLYFSTVSPHVVSFWRMDSNYRLEGFHVNFSDITRERENEEIFTSIDLTPYYDNIKTSFVILGTSRGAIIIVDKEKKTMIRKYVISKFPITKVFFSSEVLFCGGESPILYHWKISQRDIDSVNAFDFIEKEKSSLLFLDSCLTAYDIKNGREGLCGSDTGTIFFVNFEEKAVFKIISSHVSCKINSIESDMGNENILTAGNDGTVRCWTQDSFDQKFQLYKHDEKCEDALLNHTDNVCIVHYSSSYLRVYNMSTLKSLGIVRIPDNDICCVSLCFNNQGLIASSYQDKVFVIDVQNWDPLSVLYTELTNTDLIMPKNQNFKSIDTKNIHNHKSLAAFSFSDGTVCSLVIEKNQGKIEHSILDRFNMIDFHISKSDDKNVGEMYLNLSKCRSTYISSCKFSINFDDILFSFHECLQFVFMRNYTRNEMIRRVALNYFPSSFTISPNDKHIAVGTKEGLILLITRLENNFNAGCNMDTFAGHYDMVSSVKFNADSTRLFSSSYSELIVWNIN